MKKMMTEAQLANLKICHRKDEREARTVYASARLTPSGKKELQEKLNRLKMTLADFLESVADGEVQVVKSSENNQKIVARIN